MVRQLAFWALHRHFDASLQGVDDAAAESAVVALMAQGLLRTGR